MGYSGDVSGKEKVMGDRERQTGVVQTRVLIMMQ